MGLTTDAQKPGKEALPSTLTLLDEVLPGPGVTESTAGLDLWGPGSKGHGRGREELIAKGNILGLQKLGKGLMRILKE